MKKATWENHPVLENLINRKKVLEAVRKPIAQATALLIKTFTTGGKLLVCGNGGSAADADHIVGELMKGFENKRPFESSFGKRLEKIAPERGKDLAQKLQKGLPAISLTAHQALTSAILNDIGGEAVYAQQVAGWGNRNDVLMGLSTSGNSVNVVNALITARAKGMKTIGLTGETGGELKPFCDVLIAVPETRTAFVQELQQPVYHAICLMVEEALFGQE